MSDRLADLAPEDASAAMAALDAAKAPVYELAYQEARRALDGQESALAAFRTRAGVVLSAAAIVTSFLGGQALDAHDSLCTWSAATSTTRNAASARCGGHSGSPSSPSWSKSASGSPTWRSEPRMATGMTPSKPTPATPAPAPKPQPIFPSPMNPGTRGGGATGESKTR
jgi:hypothetical protein